MSPSTRERAKSRSCWNSARPTRCRCFQAGSSPCRRYFWPHPRSSTIARRAPPAGRRRCLRSAAARGPVSWSPRQRARSTTSLPAAWTPGMSEERSSLRVPLALHDVEEQSARGIGHVGHVLLAAGVDDVLHGLEAEVVQLVSGLLQFVDLA